MLGVPWLSPGQEARLPVQSFFQHTRPLTLTSSPLGLTSAALSQSYFHTLPWRARLSRQLPTLLG